MTTSEDLTLKELEALKLTGELWGVLCSVVGDDEEAREADLAELAPHIHAIQHAIMAQVACRRYPDTFRLLGELPEWAS